MNRFIKTFVDVKGRSVANLAEQANKLAKEEKLTIVSAQLVFSGVGRTYEEPVLTVVFEKVETKTRKPRKKAGEVSEDD